MTPLEVDGGLRASVPVGEAPSFGSLGLKRRTCTGSPSLLSCVPWFLLHPIKDRRPL